MALIFDGTDDEVQFGSDVNIAGTDFTIAFWMNAVSYDLDAGEYNSYLAKRLSFGNMEYSIYYNNIGDSNPEGLAIAWGNAFGNAWYSGVMPSTGTWHHVMLTREGNTWSMYSDGALGSTLIDSAAIPAGTEPLVYGALSFGITGQQYHFHGSMEEVAIWSNNLNAHERKQLSSSRIKGIPLQIQKSNLQIYTPLDDIANGVSGNGLTLKDRSGNDYDGTGVGLVGVGSDILSYSDYARAVGISVPAVNATATPDVASVSVTLTAPTLSISSSVTVSPTLASASVLINAPVVSKSISVIVTTTLVSASITITAPTVTYAKSVIVSPTLESVSISVGTAVASTGGSVVATTTVIPASLIISSPAVSISQSRNVSVSLASVSVTLTAPITSTSSSVAVSPSIVVVSVITGTAIASTGAGAIATPSLLTSRFVINAPTIIIGNDAIAKPAISRITFKVFDATVPGAESNIDIYILLQSRIKKDILIESELATSILLNSRFDKRILKESQL